MEYRRQADLYWILSCIAISVPKRVDLGIISATGFQQNGYLFFLFFLLFLYPLVTLLFGKPMNKILGMALSGVAVFAGIYFAVSKTVEILDSTINAAGSGLYLFIFSSILLLVGVLKYQGVPAPAIEPDLDTEKI